VKKTETRVKDSTEMLLERGGAMFLLIRMAWDTRYRKLNLLNKIFTTKKPLFFFFPNSNSSHTLGTLSMVKYKLCPNRNPTNSELVHSIQTAHFENKTP